MKQVFYLAIKDLCVLKADKANVFWVFGFPVIYALFFGAIFSGTQDGPSNIRVGVVNEDQSDFANTFVEKLKARDTLSVELLDRDEAMNRVRKGKMSCALMLKSGFGEDLGGMFSGSGSLEIATDPGRAMEAGFLQGLIIQSLFEVIQERFVNLDFMNGQLDQWREEIKADTGVGFEQGIYLTFFDALETMLEDVNDTQVSNASSGFNLQIPTVDVNREQNGPVHSFQITFPQAMLWGILGCAATFAVSIVKERTSGTLARLQISPIQQAHILSSKGLACFMMCGLVIFAIVLAGKLIYKVPIQSPILFVLAAICVALCFVGIMMLVSTLGKTEQSVGGASWATMMVMAMLGGGMVPLLFMPSWLQTLSLISPVRWGIYALEGGIWRGFTWFEMLGPCAVLLTIGTVCFGLGTWLFKRSD